MAKNKIKASLEVDDKGNLKKLAKDSNKAGKGLDNVAKNARTADRNLKGAAAASANGTKNFSKMAQGTGGLVGAYATLAANIFAITAAFSFLKSAADFRVVQESQIAFTGATGQGMKSLTADIQAASDSMLNFQAASEAASIGIASGLSASQITELSEGAANLSKILGRDVTDSFNRLVRGVTKAEPELLDELGITLRLADAQENYATTLKKSAKDLSNFEKKQAVFAEVQGQLEAKYNAVAAATDINGNAMDKLAVSFDKVLHPIKEFVSMLAEPVATFFSKNIQALGITLALLAVPLIKQIIPGLNNFAVKAEESAQRASDAFKQTKADIDQLMQTRAMASADPVGAGRQALQGIKTTPGSGAAIMQQGGTLSKRQLAAMRRHAKQGVGIVKQMTKQQKAAYLAAIEAMIRGDKKLGMSFKNTMTKIQTTTQIATARMKATWQSTMAFMGRAATKMGKGVNTVMKGLGLLGVLIMIKDMAEMALRATGLLEANKDIEAYAEKLDNLSDSLDTSVKEFEKFSEMQETMRKRFDKEGNFTHQVDRTRDSIAAFGKMSAQMTPKIMEMMSLLTTDKVSFDSLKGAGPNLKVDQAEYDRQFGLLEGMTPQEKRAQILLQGIVRTDTMLQEELRKFEKGDSLFTKIATTTPDTEKALENLNKAIDTTLSGIKATGLASTDDGKRFIELLEKIKDPKVQLTGEEAEEFEKLGDSFEKTGGKASFLKEQQKELTKQFNSQINAITMFETPQTKLIKLLKDQLNTERELAKNEGQQERIENLTRQIEVTQILNDLTIAFKKEQEKLKAITAGASVGASPLQKAEITRRSKLLETDIKRNEILRKMNLVEKGKLDITDEQKDIYASQLQTLNATTAELERQGDLSLQLIDNMTKAFESGTTTGIADLIKGNEKSFKDAILSVAQATLNAAADTLAQHMTRGLMGKLFTSPAIRMKNAMIEGGAIAAAQIKAAIEGKEAPTDIVSPGITKLTSDLTGNGDGTSNITEIKTPGQGNRGIFGGFIDSLKGIFSLDTPFLKGLQGVFKGVLGGFENIFGGLVDGLFGSGSTDGLFAFIGGLFGGASGGIMTPKGKMSGYSTGGVARGSQRGYPAILHGTEAVVPLPNGKSIPVEMNKGAQQTQNNIVVNVSADGRTSTQGSTGPDMDKMGIAVAKAVQVELQNQKRSGGILNPYGVA